MECMNSSVYEPSPLVAAFHGIPHRDINLGNSPDTFQLSLDYFEAVIIWACVPILAVICMFILMSVYFICVCCCCCCQQHDERSKGSKVMCGLLVILLILSGLGCCGVALWAEFTLNTNINSATTSATSANGLIQSVQTQAKTLNFTQVNTSVADLSNAILASDPATPGYSGAVGAVVCISTFTGTLEGSFSQIQNEANVKDFSPVVDAVNLVELSRHWAVVGYVIVTILVLFLMALSVCCGAICCSPACMIIALIFLGFFAVTMWIAVGANLAYLVIAGDICSEPDDLIRRQFTNSSIAGFPASTLDYYLICEENCYPSPFAAPLMSASEALSNATCQDTISTYISTNSLNSIVPLLEDVVTIFGSADSAISNITMLANCTGLNGDYLGVVDGLCQDGYLYSLILFAMACGVALIFIMILFCGSFYAGLFAKGRTFDDETIVYDFPNDNSGGPSPWESYGTQQRYHNNTQPQFNNSFNMQSTSEPPKYADLNTPQESSLNSPPQHNGARISGVFDNLG